MKIKINANNKNQRLDKFLSLSKKLELSRSQIQKQIKNNNILVNNEIINSHYLLKENDEILIKKDENKNQTISKKPQDIDIKIIDEEDDFLIINKPNNLMVHPVNKNDTSYCLSTWIQKKYPKIKNIGENKTRPGIVHRLDKHVNGLMIIAKTNKFFQHIKKQFQNRNIKKKYLALVHGEIKTEKGEINFPLKRSSKGHKIAAMPYTEKGLPNQNGKEALTFFQIKKKYINYTLLDVEIKTGRTHQIRAHLAALGHPIVGDNLYGTHKNKIKNEKIKLERIFLIAYNLEFKDLLMSKRKYKIKMSEKLNTFLKKLKTR